MNKICCVLCFIVIFVACTISLVRYNYKLLHVVRIWFTCSHPPLFCQPDKCGRFKNRGTKNNFLLAPLAKFFLVPFSQIAFSYISTPSALC